MPTNIGTERMTRFLPPPAAPFRAAASVILPSPFFARPRLIPSFATRSGGLPARRTNCSGPG